VRHPVDVEHALVVEPGSRRNIPRIQPELSVFAKSPDTGLPTFSRNLKDERTGEMIPSTAVRAVKNSVSYATGKKAMRHAMAESGITDPNEQAAFMAQMDHDVGADGKLTHPAD
jgi:putative chitinase